MAASMIYSVLKKDHDELKPMLKELASGKMDRLETMARELKAHSQAEEKVFYKRLEREAATRDLVAEGYKEHEEADRLSKVLMLKTGNREQFAKTAMQLQDAVLHHVREEEGELFTKAKTVIDGAEARSIAERFQAEKERLMGGATMKKAA